MTRLGIALVTLLVVTATAARGQQRALENPFLVGELRLLAVGADNSGWLDRLHRAGWLEADGQVLRRDEFPALYEVIGRTWTPDKTPPDRFAIPDLRERPDDPNPFGVLGPEVVTGGRIIKKSTRRPAKYFLYTGKTLEPK
jgi:hypothetical protein